MHILPKGDHTADRLHVPMVDESMYKLSLSRKGFAAVTQPVLNPGATILENESVRMTRPSVSRAKYDFPSLAGSAPGGPSSKAVVKPGRKES